MVRGYTQPTLDERLTDPAVTELDAAIYGPPSFNGGNPVVIRISEYVNSFQPINFLQIAGWPRAPAQYTISLFQSAIFHCHDNQK